MLVNEKHSFRRESRLSSHLLSFITVISALVEAVILLITVVGIVCHCQHSIFPNLQESKIRGYRIDAFITRKIFSQRSGSSNLEFLYHVRITDLITFLAIKNNGDTST